MSSTQTLATPSAPHGLLYRLRWSLLKRIGRRGIVAELGGCRLNLDFGNVSARAMYYGAYEKDEQQAIAVYVKPGMTVLDVGANLGFFTLLMAQRAGSAADGGRVFAFEPNPRMHRKLCANIEINPHLNDGRIEALPIALGAEAGRLQFFCPVAGHEGVGGLKDTQRAPLERVVEVDVLTLDEFALQRQLGRLDFIKLDIEGGELGFLRGARRTLERLRPVILYEACEKNTAAYGYKSADLHAFLHGLDYETSPAGGGENFIARPRPRAGAGAEAGTEAGTARQWTS